MAWVTLIGAGAAGLHQRGDHQGNAGSQREPGPGEILEHPAAVATPRAMMTVSLGRTGRTASSAGTPNATR